MNSHENIYKKANALAKKFQTRNPKEIINALGILLKTTNTKSLLGMYTVFQRNRVIFISNGTSYLTNLVLAHELGHDQLHRDECHNGKQFHETTLLSSTSRLELEANIFAAHLIIDDDELKGLLEDNYSIRALAHHFKVTDELINLKLTELSRLGIIDIDLYQLNQPASDFLKDYAPEDTDYFYC